MFHLRFRSFQKKVVDVNLEVVSVKFTAVDITFLGIGIGEALWLHVQLHRVTTGKAECAVGGE